MSWKVWPSQRFQYLVGAIMAAIATACFIGAIVLGILPAELRGDLPYDNTKTEYRQRSHDPLIDHAHIERAVGECHGLYTPAEWPEAWPRVAQVRAFAGSPAPTLQPSRPAEQKAPFLAALERAALFQSDRLVSDRYEFEDGIKLKLDRVRQTQIKVLLFSAAASFLIGLKTLLSHNDGSALAFQSFMKGAWLPVSIAALLVPVIATVYSGVIAFDGDLQGALRFTRALSQLEQLHGRIVVDIVGDPYLCRLVEIDGEQNLVAEKVSPPTVKSAAASPPPRVKSAASPSPYASECLLDRAQRVVAWEQRYEQILNDASQALAQAGDLPKPGDTVNTTRANRLSNSTSLEQSSSSVKIEIAQAIIDPCLATFGAQITDTALASARTSFPPALPSPTPLARKSATVRR